MADKFIPEDEDENLEGVPDLNQLRPNLNDPDQINTDEIEIEDQASQLASTPGKNILILGIMGIVAIIFLYNMVFKEDEATRAQKKQAELAASQPVDTAINATPADEKLDVVIGTVDAPELPEIEALPPAPIEEPAVILPEETFGGFEPEQAVTQPTPLFEPEPVTQPQPPVAAPIQSEVVITGPTAAELAAHKAARRKSGMLMVNGGGSPGASTKEEEEADADLNTPVKLTKTSAAQVTATKIGNTNNMIAQGKMLEAILETAINTDLPGMLRAVVSRDIYSESGKNILIPKGSRLIGEYDSNIERGQRRVIVSWSRVIRPDGIDVAIDSPGTDKLGHAGISGIVDNKYFEIFSHSILLSALTVGGSILVDKVEGSNSTSSSTTTATDGSSTTSQSGTPTDFAILEGVQSIGDTAGSIVQGLLEDQPVITVQQGTLIKVFVNRDLVFPKSSVSDIKFVD